MNWISVKESLPTAPGPKLVYVPTIDGEKPFTSIAWHETPGTGNTEGWRIMLKDYGDRITHWMELPAPPE